jgi:hypothetical protein
MGVHMRIQSILLICFMVLVLLLSGCQRQTPALAPGERFGFDSLAIIFNKEAQALVQVRSEQDRALLYPDYEARLVSVYLSRHDGVVVAEAWNEEPGGAGLNWTKDRPLTEYHHYERGGGKFVLYGQEFHTAADVELDREIVDAYANAWSTGDPESVTSLYNLEAVRHEALLWGDRKGNPAIRSFASDFFTTYPGAHWELLQTFGEVSKGGRIGGVFAIQLLRSFGRTCDIHALIILDSEADQIDEEWVYYQADSLVKCGWVR